MRGSAGSPPSYQLWLLPTTPAQHGTAKASESQEQSRYRQKKSRATRVGESCNILIIGIIVGVLFASSIVFSYQGSARCNSGVILKLRGISGVGVGLAGYAVTIGIQTVRVRGVSVIGCLGLSLSGEVYAVEVCSIATIRCSASACITSHVAVTAASRRSAHVATPTTREALTGHTWFPGKGISRRSV
ncbi:hypothetical protein BH20ACT11_BH20ACT11_05140 [soil metagenome]